MEAQVRRTKIIATLGPATDVPGMLKKIIVEGVDVVRLNLSHGKAEDHVRRAKEAREVAAELGREIAVLADLQGPKIRIEKFLAGPVIVESGQPFELDCRAEALPGDATRIGVSYLGLPNDVKTGDTLLIDDGLISLLVDRVEGTSIFTTVLAGGTLSDRKGINRMGGGLSLTALAEKDKSDIKVAAALNADFLAISFVKSAADIEESRKLMRAAGGNAAMVAKIERSEAIESVTLAGIIDASDVVMVARGDLGVEIGDAELPGIQKKIIRETLARNKVVITATQMMQSMVDSPIPTRAEVLDVANAVLDGTDAVMLSGETASGKHPDKAVAAMARVCLGAERQFEPAGNLVPTKILERVDQAVALAAMYMAGHIGVRAIIALTESGGTAQWLSRYRSLVPIYAMSRRQGARRRMMIYRDVTPVAFDPQGVDVSHTALAAVQHLFNMGCLAEGERVILTTGDHTGLHGGTNTLKLLRVGPGGIAEGLGNL